MVGIPQTSLASASDGMSANNSRSTTWQAEFATFALHATDIDGLLSGACAFAWQSTAKSVALWTSSGGRLTVHSALGFQGIEDGMFRAEVTRFRPEGQAITNDEVIVRERVVAAPISLYGRSNGVIAAYFDRDTENVADIASSLTSIAAITSLAQDRLHSQQERLDTQKLAELGRMANGIVHEIATPLQFISNNLLFLQNAFAQLTGDEQLADADKAFLRYETASAVERSRFGMQRVHDIVYAMKTFSGSQQEFSEISCNDVLSGCLLIAQHELHAHTVETDFDSQLPAIMGNEGALAQALLNLIVNAKHAMDDSKEAGREDNTLSIRTSADQDRVFVHIGDTGLGIPRRIRARIWEPFFTTKESGVGTGQGLPLVRSIVEHHEGSVEVETSPSGTTFILTFPVASPTK